MSEIELILAALMSGVAAGATATAQSAVTDAFTGLRDLLRRALARYGRPDSVLDAVEAQPGAWQTDLRRALSDAGVDRDTQVLAAARALLAAADPAGAAAGKYTVDVSHTSGVQVGDQTVHIDTNYGAAAGTMTAPVSISYGQVPGPPARPEA